MISPRLDELPPPPDGKTGWPWTVETPTALESPASGAWPKLTVVTPSFNQGQFIEETIRSVFLQGYPKLEYIIMDGGSTDGSVEIIRRYEKWLAYWVTERDRGQSNAINKGFMRATGDVCAWLNSDDVYLRNSFQHAMSELREHPDIALLYGDAILVDSESRVDGHLLLSEFTLTELLRANFVSQPATFFRTSALKRAGVLKESLHLCMDYDLWLRLALQGKVAHLSHTLAAMRMHPASKTSMQIVKMSVELVEIAADFLKNPQLDSKIRDQGEQILIRQRWVAGSMLWFGGQTDAATEHLKMALNNSAMIDSEELAVCAASAAVQNYGSQAVPQLREFVARFSLPESVGRQAEAWALALNAHVSPSDPSFYRRIARAIRLNPSKRVLRTLMPLILLRTLGDKTQNTLRQLKRSATHSPVGLSLSEIS